MKTVQLRTEGRFKSTDVFRQVIDTSPQKPLSVDEIRKRCRVLDALDKANGILELEDIDHLTLKLAIQDFPFNVADRTLLQIIDDVLEAKAPEKN